MLFFGKGQGSVVDSKQYFQECKSQVFNIQFVLIIPCPCISVYITAPMSDKHTLPRQNLLFHFGIEAVSIKLLSTTLPTFF